MNAMIMDGVHMGRGAVAGPGIILRDDVAENTVAVAHQKHIHLPIDSTSASGTATDSHATPSRTSANELPVRAGASEADNGTLALAAVYAAIDELNLLRPVEAQLVKSPQTSLSELASIDLVNLIVETEMQIDELTGLAVNLGNETTSTGREAFVNVDTFVREIQAIMDRRTA